MLCSLRLAMVVDVSGMLLPATIASAVVCGWTTLAQNTTELSHTECGCVLFCRWLYENKLTSIPDSFGNMSSLQRLWLDRNKLKHLPASLAKCERLCELYLDRNDLQELPQELAQLTNLRRL